jgi:hypothetical protein
MSKQKKPEPVFELVFTGGGIYPEKIPIAKVTESLSAVKRLAAGEVLGDQDEDEDETDGEVRLLDVTRSSSAVFRFVGLSPKTTLDRLRQTGRMLSQPGDAGENEYILRPVKDLSAVAHSLNCQVLIREAGKQHDVLARIEPDSFDKISKWLLIKGTTNVSGTVQRVGGATETRCALRVPFQPRLLYCKVETKDVARKLGDALYQRVVASGSARWMRHSMRLYSFTVHDVFQTTAGSISDHLKALWEAGLSDWQNTDDPDELLHEIRGNDE